jgi:hypothetical protein
MVIGVSIFMLSFIFIAQYIPSVFVVEKGEIGSQPLAYRTAALLTEDPGYWTNGSANGTDWWNHTGDRIRIGLTSGEINVVNINRIQKLVNFYDNSSNYTAIQTALGLTPPQKSFDYNISLQAFTSNSSSPEYVTDNGEPILLIGKPVPSYSGVAKYERYVVYDNVTYYSDISSKLDTPNTVTYSYSVSPPVRAFVIVTTGVNDNETATQPWMQVWFDSPSNPKIIDVSGENETIGSFDITDEVNSQLPSTIYVKVHNVKGYVIQTQAGNYIGGRIGAKLVVALW